VITTDSSLLLVNVVSILLCVVSLIASCFSSSCVYVYKIDEPAKLKNPFYAKYLAKVRGIAAVSEEKIWHYRYSYYCCTVVAVVV